MTALMHAISEGNLELVKVLVAAGAELNIQTNVSTENNYIILHYIHINYLLAYR